MARSKCRIYSKNFGEFFSNQIEYAGASILSRTDKAKHEKVEESVAILRGLNEKAPIITTPIEQLSGEKLLETMEHSKSLEEELLLEEEICPECGHVHEHEHHHHADEVFTSWGIETVHKFSRAELEDLLKLLSMTQDFGTVLRAKGIVQTEEGGWLEFDMVPEETEIRDCKPDYIGRICVIGTELKKDELEKVFAK